MSTAAKAWARDVVPGSGLNGSAIAVLYELAERYNKVRGFAWPSVADIAIYTGLGERTVVRALRDLKDAGYVTVERQAATSSRYYLPKYADEADDWEKRTTRPDWKK